MATKKKPAVDKECENLIDAYSSVGIDLVKHHEKPNGRLPRNVRKALDLLVTRQIQLIINISDESDEVNVESIVNALNK
jgi:hypothetical protein